MVQAGFLGGLRYEESEHGWAIDLGSLLAELHVSNYKSGSLYDSMTEYDEQDLHVQNWKQVAATFKIQEILARHNINFAVPTAGKFNINFIIEDLVRLLRQQATTAHCAFLSIGYGGSMIMWGRSESNQDVQAKMMKAANDALRSAPLVCGLEGSLDPVKLRDAMLKINELPVEDIWDLKQYISSAYRVIKILFVVSDPQDQGRTRLQEEQRILHEALWSSDYRDLFKTETLHSCRPQDLQRGLLRHSPNILHFSGHGASEGLCFENNSGQGELLDPQALAEILALARADGLQGVIMNACYSDAQAKQLANAIGPVIAMEGRLHEEGALAFTRAFYDALGAGKSFEDAFKWGQAGTRHLPKHQQPKPRLVKPDSTVRTN
jgi:CHAT domain